MYTSFSEQFKSFLRSHGFSVQERKWSGFLVLEIDRKQFCLVPRDQYSSWNSLVSKFRSAQKSNSSFHVIREAAWEDKKNNIQSIVLSLLGANETIYARHTSVHSLSKEKAREYLDHHHLLGHCQHKISLGLYSKLGQLVAIASFGKTRKYYREDDVFNSVELVRFCSSPKITVTGGLSKLISHYIKEFQPEDVTTAVDLCLSRGTSFLKIGFELAELTEPMLLKDGDDEFLHPGNLRLRLMLKEKG